MADLTVELSGGEDFTLEDDLALTDVFAYLNLAINGGTFCVEGAGGDNVIELTFAPGILSGSDIPNTVDAIVNAGGGNDTVRSGSGNDEINGGGGDDLLRGRSGNDQIQGENGNDIIFGGAGEDFLFGGAGRDTINGGDGNDFIEGNNGRDTLNGDDGDDRMFGGAGLDTLNGNLGRDTLDGGEGRDTLNGNQGRDTLISRGDDANDSLSGGGGRDTFIFETDSSDESIGADRIEDFRRNEQIDLTGITGLDAVEVDVVNNTDVELFLFARDGEELGSIYVDGNNGARSTLFDPGEYGSNSNDNIRAARGVEFDLPEGNFNFFF